MLAAETDVLPPLYTAQISGNTFFLNLSYSSHADAEASCSANGGHLAAYVSIEEQKEVEQVRLLFQPALMLHCRRLS